MKKRLSFALLALLALAIVGAAIFRGPSLYQNVLATRLLHAAEGEAAKGHAEQAIRLYMLSLQQKSRQ